MGKTSRLVRFSSLFALLISVSAVGRMDGSADDVLERAREAAAADRHREAIDLYLRAVGQDSLLVPAVSIEIGHQYTWSEILDSAVIWYGVYLSHHPDDFDGEFALARALSWDGRLEDAEERFEALVSRGGERQEEALFGLARVNAWQEDYDEAARTYRRVLEADSGNVDARIGLAETLNLSGRNRDARHLYRSILDGQPDNLQARDGLARAYLWSGRPDLAEQTLGARIAADSGRGVSDMEEVLASMRRPRGAVVTSFRKTTSDGEMRTAGASATFALRDFVELNLRYLNGRLHKSGYPDIGRNEFGATLSKRLSDLLAATASVGYQLNRFDPIVVPPASNAAESFDLFVWDVYATFFPRDWVRVDIATNREAMDIPLPVFKRIHVTTESVGLDWRLRYRLITFWKAGYSAYSDGNSRAAAAERAEWTSPWTIPAAWRTGVVLLQGVEYTNFRKQPDNGYFSPDSDVYIYGGVRLATADGGRFAASADGRIGGEKENGVDWASIGSFEVALRFRIAESAVLSGGFYKSGSRLDSADGFRAEGVYLTLDLGGLP